MLTSGLVAVAQLLVLSLHMHELGRRTSDATLAAQAKFEELVKLDLATAPEVQLSGAEPDPLTQNVPNYFDQAPDGSTRRWRVIAGPTADTRQVTVRVIPTTTDLTRARQVELTTILRQW